mmetsp:Transcript_47389/g.88002  ORF Transcript_47389/g.88002 Transcript_47389/m.88002 type:complete len:293 (+) Transcript_47389:212-1090(+)
MPTFQVIKVNFRELQVVVAFACSPKAVVFKICENKALAFILDAFPRNIWVSHHVLNPLNQHLLQSIAKARPGLAKGTPNGSPELWQAHPTWSVLMCDEIQTRCVNVPPISPRPHRESNFLSHEAPWKIWVKRHFRQELGPCEEKPSSYECYLLRPINITTISRTRVDPNDMILHVTLRKLAPAETGPRCTVLCEAFEARRVGREDSFGVGLCCFYFSDVFCVPVLCELQVCINLHKECFTTPEFRSVIPGHRWAKTLCFVHVQRSDLPCITILFVIVVLTKLRHTIRIWRRI